MPAASGIRGSSAAVTACPRRSSRPRWSRRVFDELDEPSAEAALHGRHRRRRHPPQPHLRPVVHYRAGRRRAGVFFGLGSDGTVGANKNSVKIIGEHTRLYAQGYFVYDSKKSGSMTVSHLRFGPQPIRSTYLIDGATSSPATSSSFLEQIDVLDVAAPGRHLPAEQPVSGRRGLGPPAGGRADADHRQGPAVLRRRRRWRGRSEAGLGSRINTVMQPCFFALAGVLPRRRGDRRDQGRRS